MNYYIVGFRAIAIVCIILHHSFSIYQGWPPNCGLGIFPVYAQTMSYILKCMGLNLFVFISGYCMYYSQIKKPSFRYWLKGKIFRILIPLFVFSFAYYMLFPHLMFDVWPAPVNGTHLWFLLMIFLCMLILSIHLYSTSTHSFVVIPIIYVFIVLSNIYIVSFRTFEELTFFFPIFVLGYWAHYKGLFTNSECHIKFFGSNLIRLLSQQSFKLYLLHQFFINLLLVACAEEIRVAKYYFVIPFVMIFSLILSLVIGLICDKILNKVLLM